MGMARQVMAMISSTTFCTTLLLPSRKHGVILRCDAHTITMDVRIYLEFYVVDNCVDFLHFRAQHNQTLQQNLTVLGLSEVLIRAARPLLTVDITLDKDLDL